MLCVVISELVLLALFKLAPSQEKNEGFTAVDETEQVDFQQVEVTRHSDMPATPPKPEIPLRMPEDEIVQEDVEVDPLQQDISMPEEFGKGYQSGNNTGDDGATPVKNPDRPPRLFKIVEPQMPEQAKEAGIKVVIEVRFFVNEKGEVEEATVANIKLYEGEGQYRKVKSINYGLTKATLNAALQWKFQPAVHKGKKVPSYSIHPFTFGF